MASESISQESGSANPVEKTLYVDSVQRGISSNSCFPDETASCMKDGLEILVNPGEMEENPSVDSSLKHTKHLNHVVDEKTPVQHKCMESVDPYSLLSPEKYAPYLEMDATDGVRRDQDLIQDSSKLTFLNVTEVKLSQQDLIQHSNKFSNSKAAECRKADLESQPQMKSSNQGSSHGCNLKLPLALPLPKAPSESWLKRTLPAVSSRNSSSWTCLGTCNYTETQAYTAPSSDLKWENIVKSSNVHHGRLRFSEVISIS